MKETRARCYIILAAFLVLAAGAWGEGNDEYTVLLIHSDTTDGSTSFVDSSSGGVGSPHTITPHADAQHSTSEAKFGASSIYCDGTMDYVSIPDSDDWYFTNQNFTIDFWVKRAATVSAYEALMSQWQSPDYAFIILTHATFYNPNEVGFWINIGGDYGMDGTLSTDWTHVAVVRDGPTSTKMYFDGTQVGSTYAVDYTMNNSATPLLLAAQQGGENNFPCYLDEVRISKGIARWTENFTPPTSPYSSGVKGAIIVIR